MRRNRLKNHKASLSSKLNQACIDGEPHNPFGFLSAAGVVNGHDELTKRQVFLPAIGFHGLKCKSGNRADAMGCLPHMRFLWIQPGTSVRAGGASTGRCTRDWNHHTHKLTADGWLRQFGSAAICSRGLSVTRRTVLTVSNNSLM